MEKGVEKKESPGLMPPTTTNTFNIYKIKKEVFDIYHFVHTGMLSL